MKRIVLAAALVVLGSASAFAADLPPRGYDKAPAMAAATNWSGLYIGGNIGYGWGNADTFFNPLPSAPVFIDLFPQTLSPRPNGVIGGVQAGYNWQSSQFVFGVEADIQGADVKGNASQSPIIRNNGTPFRGAGFLATHQSLDWFGTARLHAGFTPIDRLLLYVTGGVAFGDIDYSAQTDFRPGGTAQYPASFSRTKVGWTAGAGAEWAFAQDWSAKVEYLYMDLGNESTIANPVLTRPPFQVGYSWKTTEQIARVGVNYKFGWGAPIAGRY